jgi:hypothetical protein
MRSAAKKAEARRKRANRKTDRLLAGEHLVWTRCICCIGTYPAAYLLAKDGVIGLICVECLLS